jgi:hypothetical protein
MDSLAEPRRCENGARCVRYDPATHKPEKLSRYNSDPVCEACQREEAVRHEEVRIEPAPAGEELKARRFKDGLTAQLYLQRGVFWDAVRELRERRVITAERRLPPFPSDSGALLVPDTSSDDDFVAHMEEWLADLRHIEQRCVPARFQGSAEWDEFICACVYFDPPLEELDTFTRHGDLRYLERNKERDDYVVRRVRAPMRAMAPLRRAITDDGELEKVCFWLFDRVLEELGERYLGPAGIDVEEAVQEIYDATELNKQYNAKKSDLRREWHIVASDGVNANDIKRTAAMVPAVREAHSSGGRPSRNPVYAIKCAAFYDDDSAGKGASKSTKRRLLAEQYALPENEVKHYIKFGRKLISGEINL